MQARFIRHLYGCPWAIVPEKHKELCANVQSMDLSDMEQGETETGLLIMDGIAHVYVYGVMVPHASPDEREFFGLASVQAATEQIEEAQTRPDVQGIFIQWDTPGGYTQGVPELAEAIATSEKPIVSYVDGGMNSAGYWAGCSQTIYANEMSSVGSIGCYMAIYDQSKRFEMAGLKSILITTGSHKGAGTEGVAMTDEQIQHYADEVVGVVGKKFFEHVSYYRRLPETVMDGRSWLGAKALELNLIDAVGSKYDAMAELLNLIQGEDANERTFYPG